jgi:pimeloyl-ACP methyl ester carboxylesterase
VPAGGGTRTPPVLLVPDFGFGRELFDLDRAGLAPFLRSRGRDVFVLVRSAGANDRGLESFVTAELPAAFAEIAKLRGEGPVDVVAHGYSGTLVLAATPSELRGRVRAVIALSTPAIAEVPNPVAERVLQQGGRLTALAGHKEGRGTLELLFARRGRFERGDLAELWSRGLLDLGPRTSSELLAWMRSGDLSLRDGSSVRARWQSYDRPTLLLLPIADNYAHPEYAAILRELAPRAKVALLPLNKVELLSEDYTHVSMLLGSGARKEVFEPILRFLETRDAAARERTVEVTR